MNICENCKEKEVLVQKYGLCGRCYQQKRRAGLLPVSVEPKTPKIQQRMFIDREFEFVRNFFNHSNWIRHPVNFYLDGNHEKYTPDFYDGARNVFIEVAGTRQAWEQRKDKFMEVAKRFPMIKFEARMVTGEEMPLDGRIKWNGADAL